MGRGTVALLAILAAGASLPAGGALAQYYPPGPQLYRDAPQQPGSRGLPPSWLVDEDEDAPLYVTSATLAKFDPPRSLRFEDSQYLSHTGAPPFDMSAMSTEFTVTGTEGGSRLVVVQEGFPEDSVADEFYAACEKGWHDTLAGLGAFFEKRGKAAASNDK